MVSVNSEHPTGWSIDVLNMYDAGEVVVSEMQSRIRRATTSPVDLPALAR